MTVRLTPQQHMAVNNRGGKLLVSAAAGSGKTKVLVDRLFSYIQDPIDPANVDDFLIITYTKTAAAELRGKIAAKITEEIALNPNNRHLQRQIQRLYLAKISTVHAFCSEILREYAYQLDIPADFRVADENECIELQANAIESVLEKAYATASEDPDFCAFIDSQGFGRDDRQIPQILLQVYRSAKCHLNPDEWLNWCESSCNVKVLTDAGETPWGRYLITDLHNYLDLQLNALNKCVERSCNVEGMEKPTQLLSATVAQLKALRGCCSWDDIVNFGAIDYGRLVFSKNCADLSLAEQIKAVRNACKKGVENKLRCFVDSSEQVIRDLTFSNSAIKGLIALVKQFEMVFKAMKQRRRILDFGDLEQKMLDLLLGKKHDFVTSIAYEVGARFREIMVDEYQDSNAVQDAIFSALTHKRNNCFMVGDVKQSIYQFRLADPEIFIKKYNTYQTADVAKEQQGRKVLLSSNFRSSGGIIHAVNHVFSSCMSERVGGLSYGEEEMLREGINHCDLGEPEVELYGINVLDDTYFEESTFVAQRISELLNGKHMVRSGDNLRPIVPDDIVILLRSPGPVGNEFRNALESRGILCTTGDSTDLLHTEEIGLLCSLMQIINNPLQDIPLVAVLTSPLFCFSADELAMLRSKNRKANIYTLLKESNSEKACNFFEILTALRNDAKHCSITQLLEAIFNRTRLDTLYAARTDGREKSENLQAFFQLTANYESSGNKELYQFLAYLETMQEQGIKSAAEGSAGAVTIMSIHKSKGLEFPVVFLCGLSRSFNQESVRAQVLCHKDLGIGLSCIDVKQRVRYPNLAKRAIARKMTADAISEEMRVLYVALTRARDRLIMTYAAKNLENTLQEIALCMDLSDRELLTASVDCPGDWVLMAALKRTEAGAFFSACGHNPKSEFMPPVWHIGITEVVAPDGINNITETQIKFQSAWLQPLQESLNFNYKHSGATLALSKQTATQLKGRLKDIEVAENTKENKHSNIKKFRKPSFVEQKQDQAYFGSTIHTVLQHIRYEACDGVESITLELDRMVSNSLITEEQKSSIDCKKIAHLFATEIGQKLRNNCPVLREFKFSVLEDASLYYADVENEKVLLQGVVDCALMEPDGITVIDFKTDYVTDETLHHLVERYRAQVSTYARVLSKIYNAPIKAVKLYLFCLDEFVDIVSD